MTEVGRRIERWTVPGGPTLGVRRWGDPATPAVLLHGLGASSQHFEPLAPVLVEAGWQPHAIDLRGHGQSDHVAGGYTVDQYAADVEAYLESLRSPAVLIGHSLGAVTSVYLAGARPDLVLGVFAEDPPLYHGEPGVTAASGYAPMFTATRDAITELRAGDDPEGGFRAMLSVRQSPTGGRWADSVSPEAFEARVQSYLTVDTGTWDSAITGASLAGWDPDRAVTVPLTIVRADSSLSPAFTASDADRFRLANPHAEVIEIFHAPHGIREHRATTARYVDELTRLLASLRQSAG
jgi:pimeloyl-ACP methyl ester carboxylesterase